ncbi:Protein-lysine N-methyltransferase efm4 [Lithohypha guttulata]|uniref:Protein-lysine N-methyltransferase efm4 n=1 Tax=Lithohypha guttulata TaxID=1690604 RepID=UPI002DE08FEE|nr:Protein-lysine N-methyltransferase efm4 [Lithohypha guttulata]
MGDLSSNGRFKHLRPSELGDKDYWDTTYQNELDNGIGQDGDRDITALDSWFAEIDAPIKVLEFLTNEDFPLSPNNTERIIESPTVLDLGTGNGSSLFELKLEGEYDGAMFGVDYSGQSLDLAKQLWNKHLHQQEEAEKQQQGTISFEQMDILKDVPEDKPWWPKAGFDLVLDKGTFDAISLSAETVELEGAMVRVVEAYPGKVAPMVKPGGFLIITSVNWTENEVVRWFTESVGTQGVLEEFGRVKYPVYEFGGRKGQGVASVCFRRIAS